jgi:hypothetical protein
MPFTIFSPIATIRHNDPESAERVTLYRKAGSSVVWAAAPDEDPYNTGTLLGLESSAWSGPQWDFQPVAD